MKSYNIMRVLWFTNTPALAEEKLTNKPVGGGWIKSLEKSLKNNKGIELGIVFYHNSNIEPFEYKGTMYYPICSNRKNKLKRYFKRIFNLIEDEQDIKKYIDIINSFKPDLIHIHGSEIQYGLLQKFTNIPVVVSIQGVLSVCLYKYFQGIPKIISIREPKVNDRLLFNTPYNKYKTLLKRSKIEKKIFKYTTYIIGRTNWDYRVTRILAKNSKYFHNDEILRDIFYENKWGKKLNEVVQLFTTSGTALYKGIETIIYTAHLLDEHGIKFIWRIAGISENDSLVKIAKKSQKIDISDNLRFLGNIDENDLVKGLLNANIYIMASHIENSPNNLCEAMILGLPCIATNAGGTNTLLQDRINGLLVQDGDPFALAGAILELLNNYSVAIHYGNEGRKIALKRHNKNKIIKDLISIYNKVLENV